MRLLLLFLSIQFILSSSKAAWADPPASGEPDEIDRQFKQYLDEGLSLFVNEKNYPLALKNFESAVKLKPRDPTARKALRLVKSKMKAKADRKDPERLPPEPPPSSPIKVKDPAPAAQSPEKSQAEQADLVSRHYNEGLRHFMNEDYAKAMKEMEFVLKIDPNHSKAKKLMSRAFSLQE